MADVEKPGHTKFFCAVSQKDGKPFGLRFDPALLSDTATRIMLATQIGYVSRGYGSVTVITSDSQGNSTENRITILGLQEREKSGRGNLVNELFGQIRKENIVRVVVKRAESEAKKFIEEEIKTQF